MGKSFLSVTGRYKEHWYLEWTSGYLSQVKKKNELPITYALNP